MKIAWILITLNRYWKSTIVVIGIGKRVRLIYTKLHLLVVPRQRFFKDHEDTSSVSHIKIFKSHYSNLLFTAAKLKIHLSVLQGKNSLKIMKILQVFHISISLNPATEIFWSLQRKLKIDLSVSHGKYSLKIMKILQVFHKSRSLSPTTEIFWSMQWKLKIDLSVFQGKDSLKILKIKCFTNQNL